MEKENMGNTISVEFVATHLNIPSAFFKKNLSMTRVIRQLLILISSKFRKLGS